MSAVPPNFAASVLQSSLTQRTVSSVRDAERNQRASADTQRARAIDQAGSTIETADDASEVYTDAEGAGSQGRAFSSVDEQEAASEILDESADGEQHIDLSA